MSYILWDDWFMLQAKVTSLKSKDPSTKVGAVIAQDKKMISMGYNGFPAGVSDDVKYLNDRPTRLARTLHAEQNAILWARRDLTDCTIYIWPFPPCSMCAAMIIQSKVSRVVCPRPSDALAARWGESLDHAIKMFEEAGTQLDYYEQTDLDGLKQLLSTRNLSSLLVVEPAENT